MIETMKNIWYKKDETETGMNLHQEDGESERSERNDEGNPWKNKLMILMMEMVIIMGMIFNILGGNGVKHEIKKT